MDNFPDCLQADLTYELYHQVFFSIPAFREATLSCMRALSMKFRTMTLQANIFILGRGDEIDKFFIVGKGEVEIQKSETDRKLYKLSKSSTLDSLDS